MDEVTAGVQERTVWEFPLALESRLPIDMPEGAEVLHFNMQGDTPTIWALVDEKRNFVSRHFLLAGTGHPMQGEDDSLLDYIGTCFHGPFVWHLFEAKDGS